MKTLLKSCAAMALAISYSSQAAEKTLIDYFLPMPVCGGLTTNIWGAPGVWPRDPQNVNDTHGSKVIVVPFDGAALDRDLQKSDK